MKKIQSKVVLQALPVYAVGISNFRPHFLRSYFSLSGNFGGETRRIGEKPLDGMGQTEEPKGEGGMGFHD